MEYALSTFAEQLGYKVESRDCVDSTNRLGLQLASEGSSGHVWIVAREQTQGRARRGRGWNSPRGNLYASLLLTAGIEVERAAHLGFVAGVSMAEAVNACINQQDNKSDIVRLKWPNDILLKGAKGSGILLELVKLKDGQNALVIGIGMNVKHHYEQAPYPTQSLEKLGFDVNCAVLFKSLSQFWAANYLLYCGENGAELIRQKWLSFAAGLGQKIHVVGKNGTIEGVFTGLDDNFNCIVTDDNHHETKITAGDVHFGAVASVGSALY